MKLRRMVFGMNSLMDCCTSQFHCVSKWASDTTYALFCCASAKLGVSANVVESNTHFIKLSPRWRCDLLKKLLRLDFILYDSH